MRRKTIDDVLLALIENKGLELVLDRISVLVAERSFQGPRDARVAALQALACDLDALADKAGGITW